jgi:hypothetical protein
MFLALSLIQTCTVDGLEGLVLAALFDEDTQFAPGFSDERFASIRRHQSPAEVLGLLGEPLLRSTDAAGVSWHFSRSPHDTHFRVRVVHFHEGTVDETLAEFSVD